MIKLTTVCIYLDERKGVVSVPYVRIHLTSIHLSNKQKSIRVNVKVNTGLGT